MLAAAAAAQGVALVVLAAVVVLAKAEGRVTESLVVMQMAIQAQVVAAVVRMARVALAGQASS
tara:strand:+ start:840 stop:1028 length:189 start_codon:yes stop_codon:yes gene_type:complete